MPVSCNLKCHALLTHLVQWTLGQIIEKLQLTGRDLVPML
jgi:hypothetical protein